jgi:hypothetical protein
MRKRITKSILVGTVAVVVSAIVAGPAYGRFVLNSSQNQGSSPTQQAQQSKSVVRYEYPNLARVKSLLTPAERRQIDAVAAAARNNDGNRSTSFVPGYTDFPNVLRLQNTLTPTERRQLDAAVAANSTTTVSSSGSDFSWSDAGVGIGIGLAIAAGLGLVALVGTRRNKATPVPA